MRLAGGQPSCAARRGRGRSSRAQLRRSRSDIAPGDYQLEIDAPAEGFFAAIALRAFAFFLIGIVSNAMSSSRTKERVFTNEHCI